VSIVVASLLAVVVAQALLANGQVRLSSLQHQLSLEQSAHREAELAVEQLETPARIVGSATSQGMVHPAVTELPYVSLSVPLPTPKVTAAPTTSASTTTSTSTP
jgi:type II secretory pathway pseudopilin PulG